VKKLLHVTNIVVFKKIINSREELLSTPTTEKKMVLKINLLVKTSYSMSGEENALLKTLLPFVTSVVNPVTRIPIV
jgi:hypothetical protein